jgi:hypothetical protein
MPWLASGAIRTSIHNNDYLAERSVQAPSLGGSTIVLVIWTINQITEKSHLCNASRPVDGGVDSQA